ncbi:MAG: hypothetical protein AB1757_21325 [Acidobacteriota bacterium]
MNFQTQQNIGRPILDSAQRAIRSLGAARIQEFQQATTRQANSATFDMERCLHGWRNGNPLERLKAIAAIQEFLRAPGEMVRRYPAQVREMTVSGDFPAGSFLAQFIERFLVIPGEVDNGWQLIFDIHDVAKSEHMPNRSDFKTLDVNFGLQFRKKAPGQRVELEKVSGESTSTPYDMYGGGLGIDRVFWDDQDYLTIGDLITAFRAFYYDQQAANFYSLITALSNAINFNTGADLITKLNKAAATILRAVKNKGYSVGPSTEFIILFPAEKAGDVFAALATQSDVAMATLAGKQKLAYRFRPVQSVYVGANDGPYVILPKRKLRGGIRMDLTLFGDFDIYSYSEAIAGFGRYAGVVADTDQVKRIT